MTDKNYRILIVDDDPGIRDSYKEILVSSKLPDIFSTGASLFNGADKDVETDTGQRVYDLSLVERGEEGVRTVQESLDQKTPFAAAFIDMKMPGIDGAETARRILAVDPNINIVIVTAFSEYSLEDIVRKTGRENIFYLRKPFNPEEIRQFARVLTNQWNLERDKEEAAIQLDRANQQLFKNAEDLNNSLIKVKREVAERKLAEIALRESQEALARVREREIDVASRIQRTLLFGRVPHDLSGFRVTEMTIPSQKVDGDFYDFFKHNAGCFDLVVGDVMGKGVPAALLAAAVKSHFLRVLNDRFVIECSTDPPAPQDIVSAVHAGMIEQMEKLETFVTLCYVRFDLPAGKMAFVDCGHMRTIHYHRDSGTCSLLQGVNMPLGFPEKEAFTQISVSFHSGDLFLFYSDGLTEARGSDNTMYGEKRLVDFIQKNAANGIKELIPSVHDAVVEFSESEIFDDDFTLVAVEIDKPSSGSDVSAEAQLEFESDLNQLAGVRSFVQDFCENIPVSLFDHDRKNQVILAVNEAVTNIIKHAYQGRTGEKIQITAEASADRFVFRIYDWGDGFDPEVVKKPKFDGSQEGGFGVYIISQSVDEVNYFRDADGKNRIDLIINLEGGK